MKKPVMIAARLLILVFVMLAAAGCGSVSYTTKDAHPVSADRWIGKKQKKLLKLWGKPSRVEMKESGGGSFVVYSSRIAATEGEPSPAALPEKEVALEFGVNGEGEVERWNLRTPWGSQKSAVTGEDGDVERAEVWVGKPAREFIAAYGEPDRSEATPEAAGFQLVYFNLPIEKRCVVRLTEGPRPTGCPGLEWMPGLAELTLYVDGQNRISAFKIVAPWGAIFSDDLDEDEFRKGFIGNPLETPAAAAISFSAQPIVQWAALAAAIYFMR